ncbi:MAG: glycosyltransferase family 39 protein [Anaerolineae bacterium]|nr:glycosyltransferase family 39 protein [Anaerolineae bacterium]
MIRRVSADKRAWLVVLFVAIAGLHVWSLMRFPTPFVDEAWLASRAWGFMQTGRAFGTLDVGVFDRFEGYWTFFPWLSTVIHALALRFSPAPSLLAVRAVSLLFGVVLLGAVYSIANSLGGWKYGLLSVGLVSLSWPFFYSAHLARTDVIAAALGFMGIAFYLCDRSSRWWMGLLSGLCVALAFEIHPHSAIYGPALVGLYFLHWRWSMFRQIHFWSFVVGVTIGLAFYVGLHILPYPQTYLALNQFIFGPTHVPPLLTLDLHELGLAFYYSGLLLIVTYYFILPLVVWAIVVLARRCSEADKVLLVLVGALILAMTLLVRNKPLYYAILFSPAIDLLVAAFLLWLFEQKWQGRVRDYVTRVLALGLCIGTLGMNLSMLAGNPQEVYTFMKERVVAAVRPGDSILGFQLFWFDLYDHVYYPEEALIYYQRYAPGSTVEDAMREFRPDVFVVVGQGLASDEPGDTPYSKHLWLSRPELEAFLSQYAYLIDDFDSGGGGRVRVYRIIWE